jgi:hypothetical protein
MYGQNYIYEPVYYSTPVFMHLSGHHYRPYYPTWNWGIIRLIIMLGIHSQFSDIETTSIYAWILTTIIIMLITEESEL